jgi:hypothetical protein
MLFLGFMDVSTSRPQRSLVIRALEAEALKHGDNVCDAVSAFRDDSGDATR